MQKAIYSGLTNSEAFALMNAKLTLRQELPALRAWSARRRWHSSILLATPFTLLVASVALASGLKALDTFGIAAGTFALVVAVSWFGVRSKRRHIDYLTNLEIGLNHFEDAAREVPGATSNELLARMPG